MAVWYDRRDTVFTACKLASSHTSISVFVHARIYITWFCTHFLHFFIGSVRYVTPPPLIPNLVSAAIVLRLSSPCNLFSPGDDFILLSLFLYLSLPISFCLSFLLSSPLNHFLKIRGRKWTGVTRCRIKEKKKKKSSTRNDASGPWTVLSHAPPTQLDPMLSLWILEKDAKKVLSVLQEVNSECQMISDKRHEQSRKRETRSVDWSK